MKKRVLRYLKHILGTIIIFMAIGASILIYENGSIHYGDNPKKMDWDNEGPYVFYKNDSTLNINYIKGSKKEGFYVDEKEVSTKQSALARSFFALDSTSFSFNLDSDFQIPESTYTDNQKIIAVSDIESGYRTFRDFLINNKVIDQDLNWTFGKGHLVLVGDFVDRGFSTTQVLWFIYKLEQEAKKHKGNVHFIIGNHELKNMYGDYGAASLKYTFVTSILGKTQANLYDKNSFLGKWLSSKNAIESINGNLFAHGGLHPDISKIDMTLDEINSFLRANYYNAPYPKANKAKTELLLSSKTGVSWYRGYFREDDLSQKQVDSSLDKFDAKSIVVGHTLQNKVKRVFEGKVIGIDVQHPKDYHKNWPKKTSEGLLIENEKYYRVLSDGSISEI
ncbi:metallophosphoesterase [Winogradskyella jejuensis]|uniref:Calcineurin-like phosphoesterase n=1 Tax=Winogradskyella jejuensis TaxID=1089305 RepID=A0A1M5U2T7_9FLAO|nr:metallophosphoesterase [Winogradskyella jejuensis]SHH57425.1 Calcineurin-like phosphoesterase [Winogradskyella jejuensis]